MSSPLCLFYALIRNRHSVRWGDFMASFHVKVSRHALPKAGVRALGRLFPQMTPQIRAMLRTDAHFRDLLLRYETAGIGAGIGNDPACAAVQQEKDVLQTDLFLMLCLHQATHGKDAAPRPKTAQA